MTQTPLEGIPSSPAVQRIIEAQELLRLLNFDAERCNERSALVLLALLDLRPEHPWSTVERPRLRTVEIMARIREHYNREYKPNTRETIRRQTLHQFVDAGIVILNPDDPKRPVNSPKSCYQIEPRAFGVISAFGQSDFEPIILDYLAELPGLRTLYAQERDLLRIPVTLLDGSKITLSPGGQNTLIAQIIDEFCARFTPGGKVLYIGDADEKWSVFEEGEMGRLGLTINSHGKMPDLVIYMPDRKWLILIEAASSHGPVDSKRRGELNALFQNSSAGLVFVSCFPSRAELRQYLKDIAWETEVWCADNPSHLIHFNGERFLGPYETQL
jgi:hypothetical protein